jgi:hypothetical protein
MSDRASDKSHLDLTAPETGVEKLGDRWLLHTACLMCLFLLSSEAKGDSQPSQKH